MAYTYSDLKTDIRNYTEVDSNVLSDSILTSLVKKAENKVYRAVDTDEEREYATSVLATGNRYVTIPTDLRAIRYVQLADNSTSPAKQVYLEKEIPLLWLSIIILPLIRLVFLSIMLTGTSSFGS